MSLKKVVFKDTSVVIYIRNNRTYLDKRFLLFESIRLFPMQITADIFLYEFVEMVTLKVRLLTKSEVYRW